MDYIVKLAQIRSSNCNRAAEIVKGLNVNYCIPNGPTIFYPERYKEIDQRANYSGYSCLHFAVLKNDDKLVDQFLSEGANLFQQGTFDGCTPIHLAIANRTNTSKNGGCDLIGPSKEDKLVDVLLSAHVSSGNSSNPTCKSGISHFDVACMVDHVEAVEFFLKNGESVDRVTSVDSLWPSYTPLQFAVRYASSRAVELLLKHGADVHKLDGKGRSPLHLTIECLISAYDCWLMGTQGCDDLYGQIVQKIRDILNLLVATISRDEDILNFVGVGGLTFCHVASMIKEQAMIDKFFNTNFDLNVALSNDSRLWPGWTPLHFAACTSHERFALLLQHGAKIDMENAKGETPLDLLMKRFNPKIIHSILSTKDEFENIFLSDGETKLIDAILAMRSRMEFRDMIDYLKNQKVIVPLDSPIWPGCNLLHIGVSTSRSDRVRYSGIVEQCLSKGCLVDAQNVKGETPTHLVFRMDDEDLLERLLKFGTNDAADLNNFSLFHIACATNNENFVRNLLNKGVDINRRINREFDWPLKRNLIIMRAGSTALHMAVLFENENIIKLLVENGADLLAEDSTGLTPLHLSLPMFDDSNKKITEILFSLVSEVPNVISKDGLSHVHLAAFANAENTLQDLIFKGAEVDIVTSFPARYAGQTPLHVAANAGSAEAVKLLIEAGADIHAENILRKHETPLLYALQHRNAAVNFLEKLKLRDFVDPSGATSLHLACAALDFEFIKELLEKGADPNVQIRTDLESSLAGFTPLHVIMNHVIVRDTRMARLGDRRIPERLQEFVELLLEYGADVTIMSKLKGTPLHMVYHVIFPTTHYIRDILGDLAWFRAIAECMLKSHLSHNVNPIDNEELSVGFSHFHFACVVNDVETVRKFLDNGVDINHMVNPFAHHNPGYTGLHFACMYNCPEVARVLIKRGADVTLEDSLGNTPLHTVNIGRLANFELTKILLTPGSRHQTRNIAGKTALDCYIEEQGHQREHLQFYLSHGCSLGDMYTPETSEGKIGIIMKSVPASDDVLPLLDTLIESCNLGDRIEHGFNPILNAVSVSGNSGEYGTADTYVDVILRFIEMGCDIDRRDNQSDVRCMDIPPEEQTGVTPLYAAVLFNNFSAVRALLDLGADMNLPSIVKKDDHFLSEYPFSDRFQLNYIFSYDVRTGNMGKMLASQLWKMDLVGFEINRENKATIASYRQTNPLEPGIENACKNELMKIEGMEIDATLTLKEFLTRRSLVMEYPTMPVAKKEAIDNYFKDFRNLRKEYPEFCGLLMMKYRQICNRMRMWREAKDALIFWTEVQLPDLCSEAILQHLTNQDILIFITIIEVMRKEEEQGPPAKKPKLL